jgi:hypothetical protein
MILDDYRMDGFTKSGLMNELAECFSSFFMVAGEVKLQLSYVSRQESVM